MNTATRPEIQALTRTQRITTQDVCNALRLWAMPSHDDLIDVVACLAAKVQTPNALGSSATSIIVDMLDEVVGQIDSDKVEQQAEQMWSNSKRNEAPKWDKLPGFGNVRAQLDALTIRRSA